MIKVYNTLTNKKEEFIDKEEKVRIYVCGLTPYDLAHIGTARCYLCYDVIINYLKYKGYKVLYVQNFTDIDDKIINRAKEENITAREVAEKYINEFFIDMDRFGITRADIYPKVTEHIPDIIKMIEGLIEKGYAYVSDGNVYFEVNKFKEYGKLSKRSKGSMLNISRLEEDKYKRNSLDFALWKKAKEDEPYFASPFGNGRPGWHIECSCMSLKYLGSNFTIHGGGLDLIFPHHENEIAQSEAYTSNQFVKYWLHVGFVKVKGEKMSKSLGNFITLKEMLNKYPKEVIRVYLLQTHYRTPLDFNEEELKKVIPAVEHLHNTLNRMNELQETRDKEARRDFIRKINELKLKFEEVMDDDFNTPRGLSVIFEMANTINKSIDEGITKNEIEYAKDLFLKLTKIFGIVTEKEEIDIEYLKDELKKIVTKYKWQIDKIDEYTAKELIEIILEVRTKARYEKKFTIADNIRSELNKIGIIVEDKKETTNWRIKKS